MQPVTLNELLRRARPYERWRTPISTELRRSVYRQGGLLLSALLLALLPWRVLVTDLPIWLLQPTWLHNLLHWCAEQHVLLISGIGAWLVGLGWIGWRTAGWRQGALHWHWLLLGWLSGSAPACFAASCLLGIALLNIALWAALLIMLGIVLVGSLIAFVMALSKPIERLKH
jgi:hypothetical protein